MQISVGNVNKNKSMPKINTQPNMATANMKKTYAEIVKSKPNIKKDKSTTNSSLNIINSD